MEAGVEPTTKDQKHDKDTPQEELEKLEHEDELRVEHLHGKFCADIFTLRPLMSNQATTRSTTISRSARRSTLRYLPPGKLECEAELLVSHKKWWFAWPVVQHMRHRRWEGAEHFVSM